MAPLSEEGTRMKPRSVCLAAALAAAALFPAPARADLITFTADLMGSQETPPNLSPAIGHGDFVYDSIAHTITFDVTYSGLVAGATVSHFHDGPPGVAAPVVHGVSIIPGSTSGELVGIWSSTDLVEPLTPVLEAELLAGNIYFNIHSTTFPGGEIRGQLEQVSTAVPEPGSLTLLAMGALGLAGYRWRRRRQAVAARAP
jgi:hypothetical protein